MTSSRRDFLRNTALVAGAVPLAAACSTPTRRRSAPAAARWTRPSSRATSRSGFANESPYGFTDKSGKLTGEAPELARVVFKELGINDVRGVQVDFGGLIGGLQARRFDIIAAGMFITPERCGQVAFADPDYVATNAFMVPKGNPKGITRFEDAAKQNVKLGVLTGAVEGGYATKLGVKKGNIKTFEDQPSAYEGLEAGRIDAIALTRISLADTLSKHEGAPYEVTEPFVPQIDGKEQFGAGALRVPQGRRRPDQRLQRQAGRAEAEQPAAAASSSRSGSRRPSCPASHTAAELCKG